MFFPEVIVIVAYILCVHGKNWYSATDNNQYQMDIGNGKVNHATDIIADRRGPIVLSTDDGNFKPSHPLQIASLYKLDQGKFVSLELKNKIENTNILNISRPKRKTLRRRCLKYGPKPTQSKTNKTIGGRFLEVFEVVQFDHVSCSSDIGLEGVCLHEYECENSGGTPMGPCADGYGTCCVTLFNCEDRSSARIGWFNNPGYPSPSSDRLSCTFTLDKFTDDIKQIRLDFTLFELLPPTAGNCELDQFLVLGQNVNNLVPTLCGINTGQHVYIEVLNEPLIIAVQTITEENRLFSIKVTQLTSSDELAAPTGCLQFFKEDHGHIESFNHRERSEIGITRTPGYLNNLNYAMCINRAPASCSITYTNVGEMQIVNFDTEGIPVIPPQQAGVEILNCPTDWLLIAALRLCGERLNDGSINQDFSVDAPVTDDGAGPIVIWFRSDSIYSGRGFRLYYQQNTCTT